VIFTNYGVNKSHPRRHSSFVSAESILSQWMVKTLIDSGELLSISDLIHYQSTTLTPIARFVSRSPKILSNNYIPTSHSNIRNIITKSYTKVTSDKVSFLHWSIALWTIHYYPSLSSLSRMLINWTVLVILMIRTKD